MAHGMDYGMDDGIFRKHLKAFFHSNFSSGIYLLTHSQPCIGLHSCFLIPQSHRVKSYAYR